MSESQKTERSTLTFVIAFGLAVLIAVGLGVFVVSKEASKLNARILAAEQSVAALQADNAAVKDALAGLQAALAASDVSEKVRLLEEVLMKLESQGMQRDMYLFSMIQQVIQEVSMILGVHHQMILGLEARVKALEARPARVVVRERVKTVKAVRAKVKRCNKPVVVCDEAMSCVRVR